jgi:hypothetical protein
MTIGWFLALLPLAAAPLSAQGWVEITLAGPKGHYHNASSRLGADDGWYQPEVNPKYGSANLVDRDLSTTWAEGERGDGIGQTVWLDIPQDCRTINIFSGHGGSRELYLKNNRPRRLRLSCYAGVSPPGCVTEIARCFRARKHPGDFYLDLKDTFGLQSFPFPAAIEKLEDLLGEALADTLLTDSQPPDQFCLILQLDIVDVYRGTRWDDACISEIFFSDSYVSDRSRSRFSGATDLRSDPKREGRLLADLPGGKTAVVFEDREAVLQIGEVSADGRWAALIRMDGGPGPGRRETEWLLLDVCRGAIINGDLERTSGQPLSGPFMLRNEDGGTVLEHSSGRVSLH